jgi:hypothetical protein
VRFAHQQWQSNVKCENFLFVWCVRNDGGIFQSADLCGASRNGIFINAIVQQQEVVHEKNAPRTNLKWLPFVIWDVGERALYALNSNPSLYMRRAVASIACNVNSKTKSLSGENLFINWSHDFDGAER